MRISSSSRLVKKRFGQAKRNLGNSLSRRYRNCGISMTIGDNTIISMHFTLKDAGGNFLESTIGEKPFEFIFGRGMVAPGLEKALLGMKAGEEKTIVIGPSEGYGDRDKNLVVKVHKNDLPDVEINIGQEFRKVFADGGSEVFRVSGFVEDWVYLDRNHPWAGKELHYKVKIVEVKPAIY